MGLHCHHARGATQARPSQYIRPARSHVRAVGCQAASAQKKATGTVGRGVLLNIRSYRACLACSHVSVFSEYTADLRKAAIALHTRDQLGTSRKAATGESKKEDAKPARVRPSKLWLKRILMNCTCLRCVFVRGWVVRMSL